MISGLVPAFLSSFTFGVLVGDVLVLLDETVLVVAALVGMELLALVGGTEVGAIARVVVETLLAEGVALPEPLNVPLLLDSSDPPSISMLL
jgi:hypothetical protein